MGRIFPRKRLTEARSINFQDVFGQGLDLANFGSSTYAGKTVNETTSLTLTSVWACVSLIADTISTLPINVSRQVGGTAVAVASPKWLETPNVYMTANDFWHRVITSMLLDGNAFIWVVRDPQGNVTSLFPLHPYDVSITANAWGLDRHYYLAGDEVALGYDLLHIPAFTLPTRPRGLSVIEYARQAIGLGLTAEEFGARFFGQGATVSGVIETTNEVNENQARVMAKSFQDAHGGSGKSHLPAVVSGGSWKPITVPPDQAQFLETRRFQKTEIANLFRVPPYMLDPSVSSSWGTGIEEQNRAFVQFTLTPWIVRLEEAISPLTPNKQSVRFDLEGLLRARTLDRFKAYKEALMSQWITPDEVRALEDMPPLPDGTGANVISLISKVADYSDPDAAEDVNESLNPGDEAEDQAEGEPEEPAETKKVTKANA